MKKILSIAGAIALAASLFVACSSEAADDGRNSYIDTYKLDAVDITVKAYPGYNFVSWGKSKDGVTVTVLRDDGKEITATGNVTTPVAGNWANSAIDADVKNGVKYTYTAYVVPAGTEVKSANDNVKVNATGSATNTSNEYKTYWAVKGNSKSASATAIGLDHYNSKGELTTALDLTGCTNAGDKKYVISDKNLIYKKVTDAIGADHLYVSFPTKGYLQYDVYFYKGNSFDTYYADAVKATANDEKLGVKDASTFGSITTSQNFYKVDGTTNKDVLALGAGTWKAVVKVSAPGTDYVDSYVFAKETVTIDAVDTNGGNTSIVDINTSVAGNQSGYIDSGKTIRVIWKAAKNANNKAWAADKYKVYVADGVNKAAANYTALDSANIKTDSQKTEPVYYIDYTVTDNTAPYTFWVVLSDNGKIESKVPSVTVDNYADKPKVAAQTASAAFVNKDGDGVNNDAVLTINVPSNNNASDLITVKSVKYKKVAPNDNTLYTATELLLDSEVTEVGAVPTADYTKYETIVKDVAIGTKIVFVYTLQQANKADRIAVVGTTKTVGTQIVDDYSNGVSTIVDGTYGEFQVVDATGSAGEEYKYKVTVVPGGLNTAGTPDNFDAKENYTYKVYYAKVEKTDLASIKDITSWEEVSLSIAWKEDLTGLANSSGTPVTKAWAGVKEQDVSGVFEKEYLNALDEGGKKKENGKGAKIVFKFVKTSKANVSSVAYSSVFTGHKN